MRKLIIFTITKLSKALLIIITIFIFHGWWDSQLGPVSADKTEKNIIIGKGSNVEDIAQKLKKEGLIRSDFAFKILVKQKGAGGKIQAGTFKLSASQSSEQILTSLIGGPSEVWVTLIEGWRREEMGQKLNGELRIDNGEFNRIAKEGYMFPDTYLFPHDITVEQIAKIMRANFEKKYSDEIRAKIKANGLSTDEGVILASIVEREARSDEARRMTASILLKRLKIGMGLNADATIQYALGFQKDQNSWWKKSLTKDDLKIDSPYNTYIHRGLPPRPICSPGLASLKDVAEADPNTPYLYYYHDSKGIPHYAKTLEEHNQNVANNP